MFMKNFNQNCNDKKLENKKKRLRGAIVLFALLPIIICTVLASGFSSAFAASGDVSWGVVPNKEQRVPEAPKGGAEMLSEHGGFYIMPSCASGQKKVYFTFDLGYEAGYTAEVLDILRDNNIKGVFFLCGNYLQETQLINRMIAEGHEIGNHTDRHKDLPKCSTENIVKDIADFDILYKEKFVGNPNLRFFRPPKGNLCRRTLQAAKEQNLKTMMWSIAIVDWGKEEIDATKSANKIADRAHDGAIILLHITNAGTPKMLRQLLPLLQEKGYGVGGF